MFSKSTGSENIWSNLSSFWQLPFLCCFLVVAVFLVYFQVLNYGFLKFDDNRYLVTNYLIHQGLTWNNLSWSITTFYFSNWHPVTWISYLVDMELFGLNPRYFHLTNILIHAGNSSLIFIVLFKLTGLKGRSFVVAAIFALHPLHCESVAWIAERKDVLSCFFGSWTILAYLAFVKQPSLNRYGVIIVCYTLALMSKASVVTLPVALLLLDFWPLGQITIEPSIKVFIQKHIRLLYEKVPLLALSLIASWLTFLAQKQEKAIISVNKIPIIDRLMNAVISYGEYLKSAVWPQNLIAYYPYQSPCSPWYFLGVAIILTGITIFFACKIHQSPYCLAGWLWFLGILVPMIGIVQVGYQSRANRYTYLSMVGIYVVLVWGIADITLKFHTQNLTRILAGLVLCSLAWCTYHQVQYWRDDLSLFRHTLQHSQDNWIAHASLGGEYIARGQTDKALYHIQEAIRLAPAYPYTYNDLGILLVKQKKFEEAETAYLKAMQLDPNNTTFLNNYGVLLNEVNRLLEAEKVFRRTLEIDPVQPDAHYNFGITLLKQNKNAEAIIHFKQAAFFTPERATVHKNLGVLLWRENQPEPAIRHMLEATRLDPKDYQSFFNLGLMYIELGQIQMATSCFEKALQIQPDFKAAREQLAKIPR